ncbi:DnaJ domain-containing protein [Pseudoalteromonas sp. SG45-5]|uniref:Molecular chaperone DnaJ n=1 Tax=Pseudoalteromonas aliena TaxID=247523 RepID=A0A1Q2GXP6_9GAMM|nr:MULTISPECIES: DNA-J related domain-containing protein [Pseudoalteromonas]AQP99889.1 molecular chaperone DnaJ [Pseudoalteromonas aliena]MBB1387317.1 DnaJ domain-containing protein [Pseudoalteromonas sp. SG45-5]MBB1395498.1 DnaJ domain-containing protein [Pseudoalteromonas sp. SG44-4]MBB1447782.1 DnaJ domain-containing protein [Pseudoalteromonas sp. SG41-6]TMO08847.1 molecular chaperone DnaJ [Pseudoalteromonas sp. S558]
MLNPLIDKIFDIILTKKVWQVHILASELINCGAVKSLDENPQRDLFKRNFLIMNALYQLQEQLLPQILLISTLHIELLEKSVTNPISHRTSLRDYYLDWQNYDTSTQEVDALLNDFWGQFEREYTRPTLTQEDYHALTSKWQLPNNYTLKELQKCWRQQALKHHPDKPDGCAIKFKQIKEEYEQLKNTAR